MSLFWCGDLEWQRTPAVMAQFLFVVMFAVQKVKISDVGRPKEMSEAVYQHMAEMTILVTQLVVEFAKKLPGFQDLAREDQIIVLKVRCVWCVKNAPL
jgi:hypothetical protein